MNALKLTKAGSLPLLVLLLSACALGGGDRQYRLIAPEVAVDIQASERAGTVLAVARPQADRTRDSSRILVRRGRGLLPWTGAVWVDRAPDLVQGLLVETLDGRLATVARLGSVAADYRLDLELRRFELVEKAGELRAELVLAARLLDASGALLATTSISEQDHLAVGGTLDAAVAAMEDSLTAGFARLAEWLSVQLPAGRG